MAENFPIDELKFLHIGEGTKVDFSNSKDVMTLLGYNKEKNELLNVSADGMFENMLQEGARIIITKNNKNGTFVINHAYDNVMLSGIQEALTNLTKAKPSGCISCDNQCMDFCTYNCSSNCGTTVSAAVKA